MRTMEQLVREIGGMPPEDLEMLAKALAWFREDKANALEHYLNANNQDVARMTQSTP